MVGIQCPLQAGSLRISDDGRVVNRGQTRPRIRWRRRHDRLAIGRRALKPHDLVIVWSEGLSKLLIRTAVRQAKYVPLSFFGLEPSTLCGSVHALGESWKPRACEATGS